MLDAEIARRASGPARYSHSPFATVDKGCRIPPGLHTLRESVKRNLPVLVRVVRASRVMSERVRFYTTDRVRYLCMDKPERTVLEDVVFPALRARPDMQRLLFVGVEWYTRKYPAFFADREFWTIDRDPRVAKYGAHGRHIVDSIVNVRVHLQPGSMDAVLCHGVIGITAVTRKECDEVLSACFDCLRPGGLMMNGWSALHWHEPFPLESLPSVQAFEPYVLAPLVASRYPTFGHWRAVLDFYRRPLNAQVSEQVHTDAGARPSELTDAK